MPISLDDFINGNKATTPAPNMTAQSSKSPVSLDDFLGSNTTPPAQPAPAQPSSSGGNIFSKALNVGKNALGAVGSGLHAASVFTGFNHVMGAWNGAMATPLHNISDIGSNMAQGWQDPNKAQADIENHINATWKNPVLRFAANAADGPPIPLGPVARILGTGLKATSDIAHLTPIVSKAANAVNKTALVSGAKDVAGTLFKKGYGTSPDTMPTMNGLDNTVAADKYAILHKMTDMGDTHDLTPEEMAQIPHVMDGKPVSNVNKIGDRVNPTSADGTILSPNPVKITDIQMHNGEKWIQTELGHSFFPESQIQNVSNAKVAQSAKQLSDTLSGGFDSVHGRVNGTDAELRNTHTGSAPSLQQLFSQNAGNPIRSGAVGNYYPRRFNNTEEEVQSALDQYNATQKGLSTNGKFNMAREFPTLQDALDHGLKPEMNPYVAVGQRMAETSKAVHTDNAIKQLKYAGIVKDSPAKGDVESTTKPFTSYIKTFTDPKTGQDTSLINRSYMKPQDQSAIMRSIDPQGAKSGAEVVSDKLLKPTDMATSEYKKLALYNPLIHGHNITYNGMYLGGANPSHAAETMGNLFNGTHDPWYERALASGAISSDTKGGNEFSKALQNSVDPKEKSVMQNVGGAIDYARHGALWDADKAMRTTLLRQVAEKGGTDAEGAAKANKFLVNYNNTTPFENSVMKRIFPFYSWMKGNMPLQAEQWVNNTPKQMYASNAINGASYAMSGNPSQDGKADTGKVLADGSHVMVDPYIPSADPGKLLKDGLIPFLFNRSNPFLKEGTEQANNKAYSPSPLTTANGKDYLNNTPIRPPGADQGYDVRNSIAHFFNTINPFSGGGAGATVDTKSMINNALGVGKKDSNGNPVAGPPKSNIEKIIPWLGAFTSHSNPVQDAQYQPKQDQYKLQDQIKFKKSQGQYVSKADKRAAYRKIK